MQEMLATHGWYLLGLEERINQRWVNTITYGELLLSQRQFDQHHYKRTENLHSCTTSSRDCAVSCDVNVSKIADALKYTMYLERGVRDGFYHNGWKVWSQHSPHGKLGATLANTRNGVLRLEKSTFYTYHRYFEKIYHHVSFDRIFVL